MQTQSYETEGRAQANAFLTILNTAVMAQLSQMNVTMNAMQAQLKMLASTPTNQKRSKRKYYYWSCRSNYTHSIKTLSYNKPGHKDEAYHKKRLGGREKGCELWLGTTINKIEISNPTII